jgi:23S rRNA (cytosine1962-C5)-methyltransferase
MKLILKKEARHARVRHGHPWVFAGEVVALPEAAHDGRALPLEDERGRFLGMGVYNSKSQIVWRRYALQERPWDASFFAFALDEALQNREEESFRRLVWSEADNLPGLVVDQFDDVLVVQAGTLAADRALEAILPILRETHQPRDIILRNDAPSRSMEGLPRETRTVSGKPLKPYWAEIYELWYQLDLAAAQKTGFYLDQRQEHFKVSTMAPGWRVLDAFCNQGAFALHCARAGAAEVVAVDISAEAIALGKQNAAKNGLNVDFREANVFDFLREHRKDRFDMIILDPPSFAPNRRAVEGAMKGYKELHLRAMEMLNKGGILATYCCSHHVGRGQFREMIEAAAQDRRRRVQLLYETTQPLDHPIILNFPESEYLKGFVLRMND